VRPRSARGSTRTNPELATRIQGRPLEGSE
jgi:hypothetical protein